MSKKVDYKNGDIIKTKTGRILILNSTKMKRKNSSIKAYTYRCLIDGNEDIIPKSRLKIGGGCNVCHGKKVLEGYNDMWTT